MGQGGGEKCKEEVENKAITLDTFCLYIHSVHVHADKGKGMGRVQYLREAPP